MLFIGIEYIKKREQGATPLADYMQDCTRDLDKGISPAIIEIPDKLRGPIWAKL